MPLISLTVKAPSEPTAKLGYSLISYCRPVEYTLFDMTALYNMNLVQRTSRHVTFVAR